MSSSNCTPLPSYSPVTPLFARRREPESFHLPTSPSHPPQPNNNSTSGHYGGPDLYRVLLTSPETPDDAVLGPTLHRHVRHAPHTVSPPRESLTPHRRGSGTRRHDDGGDAADHSHDSAASRNDVRRDSASWQVSMGRYRDTNTRIACRTRHHRHRSALCVHDTDGDACSPHDTRAVHTHRRCPGEGLGAVWAVNVTPPSTAHTTANGTCSLPSPVLERMLESAEVDETPRLYSAQALLSRRRRDDDGDGDGDGDGGAECEQTMCRDTANGVGTKWRCVEQRVANHAHPCRLDYEIDPMSRASRAETASWSACTRGATAVEHASAGGAATAGSESHQQRAMAPSGDESCTASPPLGAVSFTDPAPCASAVVSSVTDRLVLRDPHVPAAQDAAASVNSVCEDAKDDSCCSPAMMAAPPESAGWKIHRCRGVVPDCAARRAYAAGMTHVNQAASASASAAMGTREVCELSENGSSITMHGSNRAAAAASWSVAVGEDYYFYVDSTEGAGDGWGGVEGVPAMSPTLALGRVVALYDTKNACQSVGGHDRASAAVMSHARTEQERQQPPSPRGPCPTNRRDSHVGRNSATRTEPREGSPSIDGARCRMGETTGAREGVSRGDAVEENKAAAAATAAVSFAHVLCMQVYEIKYVTLRHNPRSGGVDQQTTLYLGPRRVCVPPHALVFDIPVYVVSADALQHVYVLEEEARSGT